MTIKVIRKGHDIVCVDDDDARNSVLMTHGYGSMTLDYERLYSKLGRPNGKGDQYKVSAEWDIITPFGIGTIYDWKSSKKYCGKDGVSYKLNTDWHIGAHNQETADFIRSIFLK